MRKSIYYLLAVLLCLPALSSCSMLDEESSVEVAKKNYMKTAPEAELVLLGVYRSMTVQGMYGNNLSYLFSSIATDEVKAEGGSSIGWRELPCNAFTASNVNIQNTWAALYTSIYYANDFLETIEQRRHAYTEKDQQLATVYIAEARALRAMFYFELLRYYGNVALITQTAQSTQPAASYVQATPEAVYQFIEADLTFAAANLPYANDGDPRSDPRFRFARGAAQGLLAKVYATWAGYPVRDASKWEQAALTAQALIESGKHQLQPSYETLWENTGNGIWAPQESLLEVSFYSPTTGMAELGVIGKANGVKAENLPGVRGPNAANIKVVYTFIRDWEKKESDQRYGLSIANYKYDDKTNRKKQTPLSTKTADEDPKNWQVFTPGKWDTEKYVGPANQLINNDRSNVNWYILRYADVLLLYAEALNEWKGAPTPAAYDAVNRVRRRGFGLPMDTPNELSDLTPGMGSAAFQQAVRRERSYELAFEGHRRLDLVRWGIYARTVDETDTKLKRWFADADYPAAPFTKEGKHELLPIPQRDLDLMTKFKQNPGW